MLSAGETNHSTNVMYAIKEKKAYLSHEASVSVITPASPFDIEKEPVALEVLEEGIEEAEIDFNYTCEQLSNEDVQDRWRAAMQRCLKKYKIAKEEEEAKENTDEVLE